MVIPPLTDNVKERGFLPFLVGVLLGMALVCAAVYVYFASGCAPVATADPELPFESLLAGKALHARMLREVPRSASPVGTPDDLLAGARVYLQQCAVCHGRPAGPVSPIGSGMYPPPPQFFHNQGTAKRSAAEDYWTISGGIRFTGMPRFRDSLSPAEIRQISLLLAQTSSLPAVVYKELTSSSGDSH